MSINQQLITGSNLNDFVTLFQKLKFLSGFLQKDPDTWNDDNDSGSSIVPELKVVCVHAEKSVAVIQEEVTWKNGLMTKDEQQRQFLLKIVQEHRKENPDSRKKT